MYNFFMKEKFIQSLQTIKNNKKGFIYAILVALFFSFIPVLSNFITNNVSDPFFGNAKSSEQVVLLISVRASAFAAFIDLWTLIFTILFIFTLKNVADNWKKIGKLAKTKSGFLTLFGGVIGGPVANTMFFATIPILSPSVATLFIVLELVFVIFVGKFLFKRVYNRKIWIGIAVILTSIVIILVSQFYATKDASNNNILIGSILAVVALICYTIEALFVDRAISLNKIKNIKPIHYLQLKAISQILFDFAILLPITGAIFNSYNTIEIPLNYPFSVDSLFAFSVFANFFSGINFLIIFIISIFYFAGRLVFYESIKRIGSTVTNVFVQLQNLVTPIIAGIAYGFAIAFGSTLNSSSLSATIYDPSITEPWFLVIFWIFAIVIFIAAIFTLLNKPDIDREKERITAENKLLRKAKIRRKNG